jgi:hypothetical protein
LGFLATEEEKRNGVPSFSVSVPPPPSSSDTGMWWEDCSNRSAQPAHPQVSEKIARQALLEHVKSRCCYGEGAAKNMAITKLKYTSAFHVSHSNILKVSNTVEAAYYYHFGTRAFL